MENRRDMNMWYPNFGKAFLQNCYFQLQALDPILKMETRVSKEVFVRTQSCPKRAVLLKRQKGALSRRAWVLVTCLTFTSRVAEYSQRLIGTTYTTQAVRRPRPWLLRILHWVMKKSTDKTRHSKPSLYPRCAPDPPPSQTMSSWLERQASNHQVQLAATAVLSGIAVAGIIYGTQTARRKVAVDELKASIPELSESHHAQTVCGGSPTSFDSQSQFNAIIELTDCLSEAYESWIC